MRRWVYAGSVIGSSSCSNIRFWMVFGEKAGGFYEKQLPATEAGDG